MTTGNLCVCFPEIPVLFQRAEKRQRRSIELDRQFQPHRYNQHGSLNFLSQVEERRVAEPSDVELGKGYAYGVHVSPTKSSSPERQLVGVHVTDEIVVESHLV